MRREPTSPIFAPREVGLVLAATACGLAGLGLAERYYRIVLGGDALRALRLNPSAENAIPAWFSSSVLLLAGVAVLAIALAARREGDRLALRWAGLAAILLYLSLDESVSIHEVVSRAVARAFDGAPGPFGEPWVLVALVLMPLVATALWPVRRSMPHRTAGGFALAAGLYVLGGAGMETAGAWLEGAGGAPMALAGVAAVEELLEMLGATVLLLAAMVHLAERADAPVAT